MADGCFTNTSSVKSSLRASVCHSPSCVASGLEDVHCTILRSYLPVRAASSRMVRNVSDAYTMVPPTSKARYDLQYMLRRSSWTNNPAFLWKKWSLTLKSYNWSVAFDQNDINLSSARGSILFRENIYSLSGVKVWAWCSFLIKQLAFYCSEVSITEVKTIKVIHSIATSLELLGNTSFMRTIYLFLFVSNAEENLALKSLANLDPTFRNLTLAFLRLSQLIPIDGFSRASSRIPWLTHPWTFFGSFSLLETQFGSSNLGSTLCLLRWHSEFMQFPKTVFKEHPHCIISKPIFLLEILNLMERDEDCIWLDDILTLLIGGKRPCKILLLVESGKGLSLHTLGLPQICQGRKT